MKGRERPCDDVEVSAFVIIDVDLIVDPER
jgi:hypothetical protein